MEVYDAIDYAIGLIGIPYGWWTKGALPKADPMWCENAPVPETDTIKSINCAGLMNLILRFRGRPIPHCKGSMGGTKAYYEYYKSVAEPFDITQRYSDGTLVGRCYRGPKDQGHVGMVVVGDDNKEYVMQSFYDEGVNMNYTLKESHGDGYYEYVVRPEHWLYDP